MGARARTVLEKLLILQPRRRGSRIGVREAILGGLFFLVIVTAIVFHQEPAAPRPLDSIIAEAASRNKLPRDLIAAVIRAESGGNLRAVSKKGACGLMQIRPATAAELAPKIGKPVPRGDDIFDPEFNVAAGSYYLASLVKRYSGNETLALAAYNAGPSNVDRWVTQNPGLAPDALIQKAAFAETRGYVERIRRFRKPAERS